MILGIDFGASTTDAVLLRGKKIVKKASHGPIYSFRDLNSFLKRNKFDSPALKAVAITGGKSAFFREKVLGFKPIHISEIDAIGLGASFLAKAKKCLAVSFGTGTCIVFFDKGKSRHVIGTGLGGGTVTGLSSLLFGDKRPASLSKLALKGNLKKVDLSVKEVVGKSIGVVNSNATASNFAKGTGSKKDLAAAAQNMVAEAVAVLAVSASRESRCKKIVFVGKTANFPLVRRRLKVAAKLFNAEFFFPKDLGIASAAGAALFLLKK